MRMASVSTWTIQDLLCHPSLGMMTRSFPLPRKVLDSLGGESALRSFLHTLQCSLKPLDEPDEQSKYGLKPKILVHFGKKAWAYRQKEYIAITSNGSFVSFSAMASAATYDCGDYSFSKDRLLPRSTLVVFHISK